MKRTLLSVFVGSAIGSDLPNLPNNVQGNITANSKYGANGAFTDSNYPAGFPVAVHVPVITIQGDTATVTIPGHPMSCSPAHWIESIYVVDDRNLLLAEKDFACSDGAPTLTFKVPTDSKYVTAFELCNLHGIWTQFPLILDRKEQLPAPLPSVLAENGVLYLTVDAYFAKNYPNNSVADFAALVTPHTPVWSKTDSQVTVTIPHPMTPQHWITGIWVVDQAFQTVADIVFDGWNATGGVSPSLTFGTPKGASALIAFEHCNLHGAWVGRS